MSLSTTRTSTARPQRRAALVVMSLVAVVAGLLPAVPAQAAERSPRPASDVYQLTGRGYGHGRGMSQNGARGAASLGLNANQILAFYYPGTRLTGQPDTPIRVGISNARATELVVDAGPGMRLEWQGGVLPLAATSGGSPVRTWRLVRNPSGMDLQFQDSGSNAWHQLSYVPGTQAALGSSSGVVRLVQGDFVRKEVRGVLRAVASGTGAGLQTVNVLPMEQYLRSVVPSEMPAAWPLDALGAQAVAARTYASRLRYRASGTVDTCDTVSCQVYNGVATYTSTGQLIRAYEHAATNQAIARTSGTVVITGGANSFALTEFSAANGGWTASGGVSYMPAKQDPYDGVIPSASHSWTLSLQASAVERAYPAVGRLRALTVLSRNGLGELGGRILQLRVEGDAGTRTVTGAQFRSALGLKSDWWAATTLQTSGGMVLDVTGDGQPDVLARQQATGNLLLYRGGVGGALQPPSVVGAGWNTVEQVLSPGDVDRDGRNDLLARDRSTGTLWLYPGNGGGGFPTRRAVGTGWGMHDLLVSPGDVTGDGVPDLLGREAATGRLWLYPGDGAGGSTSPKALTLGWNGLDVVVGVGDVDGNGSADLIGRETATGFLWAYTFTANGSYSARKVNTGWGVFDVLVGSADLDRDGRYELVGRDPARQDGTLRSYPVLPGGDIAPGRDIGAGWNMHDAIL